LESRALDSKIVDLTGALSVNPFLYGKPVVGEHFCDRRDELERLTANVRSPNSLWLYSPRRLGKTSLIKEAFHLAGDEVETAFVDLYGIGDATDFAAALLAGLSPLVDRLAGGPRRALGWLKSLLTVVSAQMSVDESGHPVFSLAVRTPPSERERVAAEVLSIPERQGARRRRRVVIACDEFQEVARVARLERTIRSVVQHHEWTSFVFCGSQRALLRAVFTDSARPFFQFADHMTLERIPAVELLRYVRGRFETSGRGVPDEVAEDIVAQAEGHPHFTQYFAAQAWDVLAGGAVEARELATAWKERVVSSLDGAFRMFFDGLSTRQRRVLLHLASRGSEGLFSEEVRRQHGLGSSPPPSWAGSPPGRARRAGEAGRRPVPLRRSGPADVGRPGAPGSDVGPLPLPGTARRLGEHPVHGDDLDRVGAPQPEQRGGVPELPLPHQDRVPLPDPHAACQDRHDRPGREELVLVGVHADLVVPGRRAGEADDLGPEAMPVVLADDGVVGGIAWHSPIALGPREGVLLHAEEPALRPDEVEVQVGVRLVVVLVVPGRVPGQAHLEVVAGGALQVDVARLVADLRPAGRDEHSGAIRTPASGRSVTAGATGSSTAVCEPSGASGTDHR